VAAAGVFAEFVKQKPYLERRKQSLWLKPNGVIRSRPQQTFPDRCPANRRLIHRTVSRALCSAASM
ncbi:MAG: hypothetical protein KKB37_09615, partial [Alphaproteobacteria bacterium]|nr:hypothetical protein [Alphaproteobacteria bacterium]